ncbi:MAG TPA: 1,4-dihydroxy-2-naphthoate octaprenyltransferase [Selenomonadales bacterium]|nr:1,4-dihydroxy-2-naphthoate octaprenyltransferase [Selenomonadales bacterium]
MIRTWFLAMRPWSFTAAAVPVTLGAVLAWSEGSFSLPLFLLTLVGGIAVQAGTNLINTYGDFITGVDTVESARTCPQLVRGMIAPGAMRMAGILTFSFAGIIGLLLTYLCGWPVLAFGLLGIVAGYCYTAGFCPYKYLGLGSVLVFFLMGPLMVWPAYFIQTGQLSWLPVWASLPVSFLVAGILHANDIRDMREDRRAGIHTLALFLGVKRSLALYYALYTAAYTSLIGLIALTIVPWTAALPVVLLPASMKLLGLARDAVKGAETKLQLLEPISAKLHFQFGLLLVVGLALHPFLQR